MIPACQCSKLLRHAASKVGSHKPAHLLASRRHDEANVRNVTFRHSALHGASLAASGKAAAAAADPWLSLQVASLLMVAYESTRRSLEVPLLGVLDLSKAADAFWEAPFAMVLCNQQQVAMDPQQPQTSALTSRHKHFYANKTALQALSSDWQRCVEADLLYKLPPNQHQLSPPPPPTKTYQQKQAERQRSVADRPQFRLLRDQHWECSEEGGGITIDQLLCIPVFAPNDAFLGSAFVFDSWRDGRGAVGRPGMQRALLPDELPTEAVLQSSAESVRQQADWVRGLKVQQGLGNKDPRVLEAVAELQRRKDQLQVLETTLDRFGAPSFVQQLMQEQAAAAAAGAT